MKNTTKVLVLSAVTTAVKKEKTTLTLQKSQKTCLKVHLQNLCLWEITATNQLITTDIIITSTEISGAKIEEEHGVRQLTGVRDGNKVDKVDHQTAQEGIKTSGRMESTTTTIITTNTTTLKSLAPKTTTLTGTDNIEISIISSRVKIGSSRPRRKR